MASLQICIHPIYGRILILPHRNDETLLHIDDLRMNLWSLLRLYMKHHRYWNVTVQCWDDEECDDYECDKEAVEEWAYLDDIIWNMEVLQWKQYQ